MRNFWVHFIDNKLTLGKNNTIPKNRTTYPILNVDKRSFLFSIGVKPNNEENSNRTIIESSC